MTQQMETDVPTKTIERPIPFSLAFFNRLNEHIAEHYDDGSHEDREGNVPCEDEYCKASEGDAETIRVMFEVLKPLLWKYVDEYDFTEHDSFSDLRRARKHQHECGQRMTGGAVVVDRA